MHRRIIFVTILATILTILAIILANDTALAPITRNGHITPSPKTATFSKMAFSTTNPSSIWVIVNKQHPLNPTTYVPPTLVIPTVPLRSGISGDERQVSSLMAPALERLVAGAKASGLTVNLQSGYRSYSFQLVLYDSYVKRDGQVAADQESARAGYSEHQTGFAADVGGVSKPECNIAGCFANTSEGQWLAAHAYEYGFIIRYTAAKQSVTGYEDEPWHIRYVGVSLATEMHTQHILTLEEFFGVSGGATYAQP